MSQVRCPTCNKPLEWSAKSLWKPFCCERCKLIDLGAWFEEEHVIPGDDVSDDRMSEPDKGS